MRDKAEKVKRVKSVRMIRRKNKRRADKIKLSAPDFRGKLSASCSR